MEIADSNSQREDAARKLREVEQTEPAHINPNSNPPIRKDAQLKVHVVDAQNLGNVEYGHVNMS